MRKFLLILLTCLGLLIFSRQSFAADSQTGGISIGVRTPGQNENIEEIYNGQVFVGYPVTDRLKVGLYIYVTINRNRSNIETNLNINRNTPVFGLQMRF